jgi:hypothetical protein
VALTAGVAQAGNDDEIPIGSEASMTGAAVTATVQDGAAGYYNPAGLANSHRPTLDVAADCYGFRIATSPDLISSAEGEESAARAIDWVLVPSMVTYTRTIMDRWQASLGIFLPRSSDMIFRAELGEDGGRWQIATRFEQSDYNYVLAVATALRPSLRVGGSLIGVYMSGVESVQVGGGLEGGPGFTYARLRDLSVYGVGLGAGVQWDIRKNLVLGVSARTPTFTPLRTRDNTELAMVATETGETVLEDENTSDTLWGVAWTSPVRARLGVAYRLNAGGWLSVDGDVSAPLVMEYADDREWNYNVRVGGLLPVSSNLQVGAGVFTDRSATRENPVDFYGATAGIRVGQNHVVEGTRELTFATTLAGRYAYGTGEMLGATVPTEDVDDWGPTGVRVYYHELSLVIGGTVYF